MDRSIIQDWTNTQVQLRLDVRREVRYRVYRQGQTHFLEMCSVEDEPIHTLELPDGMKLDRTSYEVLLRYVLLDVIAA